MIFPLQSDQLNELFAALATAQGEMESANKTAGMAANYGQGRRYADYDDMVAATRPALSKNKISVVHDILETENGDRYLYTRTTHASGQFKAGWIKLDPSDNKAQNKQQALGSCITYYKRYAYSAAVGLTCDDGVDYDSPKYHREEDEETMKRNQTNKAPEEITPGQKAEIERLTKINPISVAQACIDFDIDIKALNKTTASQLLDRIKGKYLCLDKGK